MSLNASFIKNTDAISNPGPFLQESLNEISKVNYSDRKLIKWKKLEALLSDAIDDQSEVDLESLR